MMMRCKGFIPITHHANYHYSLSSVHSEWFTNHSNNIHTFTPITRIVATKFQKLIPGNIFRDLLSSGKLPFLTQAHGLEPRTWPTTVQGKGGGSFLLALPLGGGWSSSCHHQGGSSRKGKLPSEAFKLESSVRKVFG